MPVIQAASAQVALRLFGKHSLWINLPNRIGINLPNYPNKMEVSYRKKKDQS